MLELSIPPTIDEIREAIRLIRIQYQQDNNERADRMLDQLASSLGLL